jgi:hypothetical protein
VQNVHQVAQQIAGAPQVVTWTTTAASLVVHTHGGPA